MLTAATTAARTAARTTATTALNWQEINAISALEVNSPLANFLAGPCY